MRILTWLVTNTLAVAAAAWLVDGIDFAGPDRWPAELQEKWLAVVAVGVILGLVSAFVKPVVQLLSIPFIVLTLGLFLLGHQRLHADADRVARPAARPRLPGRRLLLDALLGALVISVVNWLVASVLDSD